MFLYNEEGKAVKCMIINTGQRTDIPTFYSRWFANRLTEGYVCVRNPFNHAQVSRYRLDPSVVDVIGFCTKNPAPMFPYMDLLKDYGQFWHVTITPYGRDIEPHVPDKHKVIEDFKRLSQTVGMRCCTWRYDPIFLSEKYTYEYHLHAFEQIASSLEGYTETAVISFIDLYPKVRKNFPQAKEVEYDMRIAMGKQLIEIAAIHGMTVRPCAEGNELAVYGADCSGCMKVSDYEKAIGQKLFVPAKKNIREGCACWLSGDIGAYNTCGHLCRYCYANAEAETVREQMRLHDPSSPFLTGNYEENDEIHDAVQKSWIQRQISLFD